MNGSTHILGLGCTAVDDLLYLDAYPAADTKAPVRDRQRHCGGLTLTALVAASRLARSLWLCGHARRRRAFSLRRRAAP